MIKIRLYDKSKVPIEIKLDAGKRHILTKNDMKRWEKIEIIVLE